MPLTRSDALLQELERHQRRREQGIPTLTVLVGPAGTAMSLWRRWLDSRRRPLCTVGDAEERLVVRAWMDELSRHRDLAADAADFLGRFAGLAPGELHARLKGKTFHERDVLLQELFPVAPAGDATAACRALLHTRAAPSPSGQPLDAVLGGCGGDFTRTFAALHALVPAGASPALLLAGFGPEWLARAARVAARLCDAVPSLVIALAVDRPSVDTYLGGPESQVLALVREGLLEVEAPSPEVLRQRLEALGVRGTEALSGSLARLAADGASEELLAQFGQAARERDAAASDSAANDRARSEAERFLWMLLDALPDTQGLFALNERAGFRINHRPVEVDFLSHRLRVAIEVDGYYHFQDPEAYRRDRRKDLALQQHGYLVLRFLAADVVERLQEIRDVIQDVVSSRRDAAGRNPMHTEESDGGQ